MNIREYAGEAAKTMRNDLRLDQQLQMLLMGLSGETGELVDLFKKFLFHGHKIEPERVDNELGDVLWYWVNLCGILGLDPEHVMDRNIRKLRARYGEKFSEERSRGRDQGPTGGRG